MAPAQVPAGRGSVGLIRGMVALSLRFRMIVVGASVVLMAMGVLQLSQASIDAYPEFTPPHVQIQTEALGLSAAEVEQLITVPIEQDLLNGVAWLEQIRSDSMPGLSSIDLIFEPGTDVLKARQVVQERMTQAHALPNVGSSPVMIQPVSSTSRAMMIGLSARDLSLTELSTLARWKVKPRLMGVPGVANVAIWGQRDRQMQVQVDPNQLLQHNASLNQVIRTAGNAMWVSPLTFVEASTPGTGGFIDTSSQRFAIQHILPITRARDLASVALEDSDGKLRLGDVASVVEDHQPLIGDAVVAGGQGLMLVVERFPEARTGEVVRGVEAALAGLRPGLSGVEVHSQVYRADGFGRAAARNLGGWALIGAGLLVLWLVMVLYSWRAVVVTVATVALSVVAAAYALHLQGASLNLMVLGGLALALGVVIDDAVVTVNSTRRGLREPRSPGVGAIAEALAVALGAVRQRLLVATLIALMVPLPILFLDGVGLAFSRPLVLAYAVAILASTLIALTAGPALAMLLLPGEPVARQAGQPRGWAQRFLERLLERYARQPRWTYATVLVLVLVGCSALPQLRGGSLLPNPQDPTLLIHLQSPPGTSLPEMMRVTTAVVGEARAVSGVREVSAHVGRALASDQVVNVNSAELWMRLDDRADRRPVVAAVGRLLRGHEGLKTDLVTYPQDQVRALATGTPDAVVVRLYGHDLGVLHAKADEVSRLISGVAGVTGTRVQSQPEEPTLQVEVNIDAAERHGLKPGDVRRAATTFFSGLTVGNLYEDQKIFDVVVLGSPGTRSSPGNVPDLLMDAPGGGHVRLGDVATVRVAPYPTVIKHDGTSRSLDVTADVHGRDLEAVLADVKHNVAAIPMPLEYHAEVLSDLSAAGVERQRVLGLALAVAIGIFLLLQTAFGSWRMAALVFLSLPLAVAGGVGGAFLVGGLMSLGALVGLIAVAAVAVRALVLLVFSLQGVEPMAGAAPDREAILGASRGRLGPVLLTAGSLSALALPMVFFDGAAGTEVLRPLAGVVLGGMLSSVLVSTVLAPSLYLRLSPASRPR